MASHLLSFSPALRCAHVQWTFDDVVGYQGEDDDYDNDNRDEDEDENEDEADKDEDEDPGRVLTGRRREASHQEAATRHKAETLSPYHPP